jgi:hypothetical protein
VPARSARADSSGLQASLEQIQTSSGGVLASLIQQRLRERGDAWKKLDETLDERERRNGH